MGGGNTDDQVIAYCEAIVRLWPEISGKHLHAALTHGIKHVRWYGKFNVMAVAEFLREYQKSIKPYTPQE